MLTLPLLFTKLTLIGLSKLILISYSVVTLQGSLCDGAHIDPCKFTTTLYTSKFPGAAYVCNRPLIRLQPKHKLD